jgi:5-methylcytosine-specific restriction endonuclease McrA
VGRLPKDLRYQILEGDEFLCRFCGIGGRNSDIILEVHHIKWRRYGGQDEPANLMTCCRSCHEILHHGRILNTPKTFTELRARKDRGSY